MKIIKEMISWIGTILVSIIVALIIIIFIFQPTSVIGPSMENGLKDGDKIIINKTQNIFHGIPNYEDIIIIDSRVDRARSFMDNVKDTLKYNLIVTKITGNQEQVFWVKRVIGRPGDIIEFKDGKVVRNGEVLEESYIKEPMEYQSDEKIEVPENSVFVMGDNRNNSTDSRVIGCIPVDHIIGKYLTKLGF